MYWSGISCRGTSWRLAAAMRRSQDVSVLKAMFARQAASYCRLRLSAFGGAQGFPTSGRSTCRSCWPTSGAPAAVVSCWCGFPPERGGCAAGCDVGADGYGNPDAAGGGDGNGRLASDAAARVQGHVDQAGDSNQGGNGGADSDVGEEPTFTPTPPVTVVTPFSGVWRRRCRLQHAGGKTGLGLVRRSLTLRGRGLCAARSGDTPQTPPAQMGNAPVDAVGGVFGMFRPVIGSRQPISSAWASSTRRRSTVSTSVFQRAASPSSLRR